MSSTKTIKHNKVLVASRINKIRSELGLSIGALAEHMGISKSTLNSYIRAVTMPPEAIVNKIWFLLWVEKVSNGYIMVGKEIILDSYDGTLHGNLMFSSSLKAFSK